VHPRSTSVPLIPSVVENVRRTRPFAADRWLAVNRNSAPFLSVAVRKARLIDPVGGVRAASAIEPHVQFPGEFS